MMRGEYEMTFGPQIKGHRVRGARMAASPQYVHRIGGQDDFLTGPEWLEIDPLTNRPVDALLSDIEERHERLSNKVLEQTGLLEEVRKSHTELAVKVRAFEKSTAQRLQTLQASVEGIQPGPWVSAAFQMRLLDMVSWGTNWDDQGAAAISSEAAKAATRIAATTAGVVREPEPIPVPDGSIELVWDFTPDVSVSAFVDANGLRGSIAVHGLEVETVKGGIATLAALLRREAAS